MRAISGFRFISLLVFLSCAAAPSGCKQADTTQSCTLQSRQPTGRGSLGQARVYNPDPIVDSGISSLGPHSGLLDTYASQQDLTHLTGFGVLDGIYVSVRNGTTCNQDFNAYDAQQDFNYAKTDARFQEANAYFAGDGYRASLDSQGVLLPHSSVKVVAHCMDDDNAYYARTRTQAGVVSGMVCLGDSVATLGASYADDSTVVVHELQHATTADTYSTSADLNQLWYDEAGALNEGVSDFMALIYFAPLTSDALDPRIFSRWALGTYMGHNYERGAHKCPRYDPTFPTCDNYAAGAAGMSAAANRVSYSYPDGLGWPYANNYVGPGFLKDSWNRYTAREEIHNASAVLTGSLWDVYTALKANHGADASVAYGLVSKLAMEALKHLPKPSPSLWSPVTFRGYGSALVSSSALLGFDSTDQTSVQNALTDRGLYGGTLLGSNWAAVGPGYATSATPPVTPAAGIHIIDNPTTLKSWFQDMGAESSGSSIVTQSSATTNNKLNAGEVVAVWFDIQNSDAVTAGGVTVALTSQSSDITFLDYPYNIGGVSSSKTQIQYQKINGTAVVTNLTNSDATKNVPVRNSYIGSNPYYYASYSTAVFLKAAPGSSGVKNIQAIITPTNGPSVTIAFPITVY